MHIHNYYIYVTGFEKTRLPHTQQQDTLHHHMMAVHTKILYFRQVLHWNLCITDTLRPTKSVLIIKVS